MISLFYGIVGYYHSFNALNVDFPYDNGQLTPVSPAGATTSQALGINLEGVTVGSYNTDNEAFGFIEDHGRCTTLSDPNGAVVGAYTSGASGHGFIDINATFTDIDVPGPGRTIPLAVNALARLLVSTATALAITGSSRHLRAWATGHRCQAWEAT